MSRLLVIAMCAKTSDYVHGWASALNVPYLLQPPSVKTNHNVGESLSYVEYIADHYNRLHDYTVFVDDAGPNHWHALHLVPSYSTMVTRATPKRFQAFGEALADRNLKPLFVAQFKACAVTHTCTDELACADRILQALHIAYNATNHDLHAGTAFVATKEALRAIPRANYYKLAQLIRAWPTDTYCTTHKWGYALERVKGVVWGDETQVHVVGRV